jgi:hypothetical protein
LIPAQDGISARAILLLAAEDDLQRIVRQRSLQFESLGRASANSHKSISAGVVRITGIALG